MPGASGGADRANNVLPPSLHVGHGYAGLLGLYEDHACLLSSRLIVGAEARAFPAGLVVIGAAVAADHQRFCSEHAENSGLASARNV